MLETITEFILFAVITLVGNEVISLLVTNPHEHLAVCLIWVGFMTLLFLTRALRRWLHQREELRLAEIQNDWNNNRI
jgi:hypothetical protein